ncbi:unnamed protein product, partial [Brachionus calyciflorus]
MRNEIKNRNLEFYDITAFENDNEIFHHEDSIDSREDLNNETIESLKKSSPFTTYFNSFLENFEEKLINCQNKLEESRTNLFYNPKLFLFIKDQLYLMPLWTGILIDELNRQNLFKFSDSLKTRLTNNPVENYFGILKNRVLLNRKVFPSELVSLSFLRLKSKYLEFYMDESHSEKTIPNFAAKYKENWSDKKVKREKKRIFYEIEPIKEKGFYYKNKDLYNLIYEDLYEFDPTNLNIKSKEFKRVSFFIDEYVEKLNVENKPMEIETTTIENICASPENELDVDFKIYNNFLDEISNIDFDFVNCNYLIMNNKELFIKLTKFLRSK